MADQPRKITASVTFDLKAKITDRKIAKAADALGGIHTGEITAEYAFATFFDEDQNAVEKEGLRHAAGLATMYKDLMAPHLKVLAGVASDDARTKAKKEARQIGGKFTDARKIVHNQMRLFWKTKLEPKTAARTDQLKREAKATLGLIASAKQKVQAIKAVNALVACRKDVGVITHLVQTVIQKVRTGYDNYATVKRSVEKIPALQSELQAATRNFHLSFVKHVTPIPKALKLLYKNVNKLLQALQRVCEIQANVDPAALVAAQKFLEGKQFLEDIKAVHGKIEVAVTAIVDAGYGESVTRWLLQTASNVPPWEEIERQLRALIPSSDFAGLDTIAKDLEGAQKAFLGFISSSQS